MIVTNPTRITTHELLDLATNAKGSIKRIFLHWTAGHYGQYFDDYHLNIDRNGELYCTCHSLTEKKPHTWQRNTGSVGVTLCCAYNAQFNSKPNLGAEPPTPQQLRSLAWVIAFLCLGLELPIDYEHVTTHAEIAIKDHYGPFSGDNDLRWDLYTLPDIEGDVHIYRPGGAMLRELAQKCVAALRPKGSSRLQMPLLV